MEGVSGSRLYILMLTLVVTVNNGSEVVGKNGVVSCL